MNAHTPFLATRRRLLLGTCALALVACEVPGAVDDPGLPPHTPEQLIERLRAADRAQDFAGILRLVTPDQREAVVYAAWFGAAYAAIGGEPDVVADYRAIVAEHGLDEDWLSQDATGPDGVRELAALALRDKDLAELFDSMMSYQVELGSRGVVFGLDQPVHELHVEEDWALARLGDSELELVRHDGVWTWDLLPDLDR